MVRDRRLLDALVGLALLVCFAGCSIGNLAPRKKELSPEDLVKGVSPMIESQKGVVSENLPLEFDLEDYAGDEIVSKALAEERGRQYMEFCYEVNQASSRPDHPDAVVERARALIPGSEFRNLKARAEEVSAHIRAKGLKFAKSLPPSQQESFMKDLENLLVKSIVLLTAGVVYAFMPDVVIWGKVAAAAGISIAAGAAAVTVMSIYEHYKFGGDPDQSFKDWLKEVVAVPQAEYAIATSVLATATALNQGPVVSGIILCVFGIFQAIDMLRPMLQIYNFDV